VSEVTSTCFRKGDLRGKGLMVNFGDVGRICLNQEIRGVCENCLWWEWDSGQQRCSNSCYHVCPLYRKRLFDAVAGAPQSLRPAV
jgi:hypothetical protein